MTSKDPLRYSLPLIVSTSVFWVIGSASAKIIFKANFETGDLSEWSKTGTASQNATPRNVQVVTTSSRRESMQASSRSTKTICSMTSSCACSSADRRSRSKKAPTHTCLFTYTWPSRRRTATTFLLGGNPAAEIRQRHDLVGPAEEGGGTLIKYGTGNLGRNGTHWGADFTIGKWHQWRCTSIWSEDKDKGNTRLWFDGVFGPGQETDDQRPRERLLLPARNPSKSTQSLGRYDLLRQFHSRRHPRRRRARKGREGTSKAG